MNRGMDSLPLLPKEISISVSEVYMNNNKLVYLDQDILDSWDLLTYIDLTDNPVLCNELLKINEDVQVLAECISETTTGEYTL